MVSHSRPAPGREAECRGSCVPERSGIHSLKQRRQGPPVYCFYMERGRPAMQASGVSLCIPGFPTFEKAQQGLPSATVIPSSPHPNHVPSPIPHLKGRGLHRDSAGHAHGAVRDHRLCNPRPHPLRALLPGPRRLRLLRPLLPGPLLLLRGPGPRRPILLRVLRRRRGGVPLVHRPVLLLRPRAHAQHGARLPGAARSA